MKENDNKYLDDFTKKVINKTSLESPSNHFTSEVMSQVMAFSNSKVTVYKPLISKNIWILIALGFIALTIYLVFGVETQESSWFSTLDFSFLRNNKVSNTLSGFTMSKTLMYAVTLFGIMICIQIPFLKNYFDKRLDFN